MSTEFLGKKQQMTGLPRPTSPIDDGLVLPELCYFSEPFSTTFIRDLYHIGNLAPSKTADTGMAGSVIEIAN